MNTYSELKSAMLNANRQYAKVVNRYGSAHPKAIAVEQMANEAAAAFWSAVQEAK